MSFMVHPLLADLFVKQQAADLRRMFGPDRARGSRRETVHRRPRRSPN